MTLFYKLLGILFILAGLPLFWTPVPIGAILMLVGLSLVVASSELARDWLRRRRTRHPRLDRWMSQWEKYLPQPFKRILRATRPGGSGPTQAK